MEDTAALPPPQDTGSRVPDARDPRPGPHPRHRDLPFPPSNFFPSLLEFLAQNLACFRLYQNKTQQGLRLALDPVTLTLGQECSKKDRFLP